MKSFIILTMVILLIPTCLFNIQKAEAQIPCIGCYDVFCEKINGDCWVSMSFCLDSTEEYLIGTCGASWSEEGVGATWGNTCESGEDCKYLNILIYCDCVSVEGDYWYVKRVSDMTIMYDGYLGRCPEQ